MYDQYFVRNMPIGKTILLIVICETKSLDLGALELLCADYKTNFLKVDKFIEEVNKNMG